jgi:putative Mn2+ efflux pump MntP
MSLDAVQAGQLLTLLTIAFALGMDAFSLGLGIGLRGIRKLDVLKLGTATAAFHTLMPLLGMAAGRMVSGLLGGMATKAGGILLLLLGGHMVYSSLRGGDAPRLDHRSAFGLLLLAFGVSVDSFSAGVPLGMFAADPAAAVLLSGFFGGVMSVAGLLLGRRVGGRLGEYGETCGGAILFAFGVMFLL